MALNRIEIDPIKYLTNLPFYDGSFVDLYTFIDLIERIGYILETYDEISQRIFLDLIKSKLTGAAKNISDINNHLSRWTELKEVLINNFGDRLSIEQLYDQMRSLKFKVNAKTFYDEIILTLRRLNMKTRTIHQGNDGFNALIIANKRAALEIFKNKLVEPMRSILMCRNSENIENAMKLLFDCNYAFYNPNLSTSNDERNRDNNDKKQGKPNPNKYPNRSYKNNNCQNNDNYYYPNQQNVFQPGNQNQNVFPFNNPNQNPYLTRSHNSNPNNMQKNPSQNQNYDRPVPMEVGNFHQDPSTNSHT